MVIIRYFKQIFSLWITRAFTAVDIIAFGIGAISPDLYIPPWAFWAIAGVGFLAANIQMFAQKEKELEKHQLAEPKLVFTIANPSFDTPDRHILFTHDTVMDGLDDHGVPMDPYLIADVEIENLGTEAGFFEWEIGAIELGNIFTVHAEEKKGFFVDPDHPFEDRFLGDVEGRIRYTGQWRLKLQPCVSNARELAEVLKNAQQYQVVLNYRTKKIGGRSESKTVVLTGDFSPFINEMVAKWDRRGWRQVSRIVTAK